MGKIFVFGDSIAYGKWDEMGGWVSRLRMHVDKKYNLSDHANIHLYNLGIPGEVSSHLAERMDKELSMRNFQDSKGNNIVIIAVGINDSNPDNWMTGKQTDPDVFNKNLISLALTCKKFGAKICFVGLTPVNEPELQSLGVTGFTNNAIKQYDNYITEFCKKAGFLKAELFEYLLHSGFTNMLTDGLHPNSEGHELMFSAISDFLESNGLIEYCI